MELKEPFDTKFSYDKFTSDELYLDDFNEMDTFHKRLLRLKNDDRTMEQQVIDKFIRNKLGGLSEEQIIKALQEKYPENFI